MKNSSPTYLRKIGRNSVIYGIGTLIRNATALVMLPIYTRYLTPADYGAVEMLTMVVNLASMLLGLRITQAMFRFYILEDRYSQKKKIISTVFLSTLALSVFGVLLFFLLSSFIVPLIFGDNSYIDVYRVFLVTLVTLAVTQTGMAYIQAMQEPKLYLSFSIFSLALQVTFNIYFIVYLELHLWGVVYGSICSSVIVSLVLGLFTVYRVGLCFDWGIYKRLLKYLVPLVVSSFAGFYAGYADKYFLRLYEGLHSVGIYSLAARISFVLATAHGAFQQSWSAARFEIFKDSENPNEIFNDVFKYMTVVLFIFGGGIAIFSHDLLLVLSSPDFYSASEIIPLFVAGVIMVTLRTFFNFGILLKEKTKYIAYAVWSKALFATILYVVLIPRYGIYGAVTAYVLSVIVETSVVHYYSNKLYSMELDFRPLIYLFLLSVTIVPLSYIKFSSGLYQLFFHLALYLLFMVCIYMLPIWSVAERCKAGLMIVALRKRFGGVC